jgi:hypothetical protein
MPRWFAAKLEPRQSLTSHLQFNLPPLPPSGDDLPVLRLLAVATHTGPVSITARWGQTDLGTLTRDSGAGGTKFEWKIPRGAWLSLGSDRTVVFTDETQNVVRLPDPNDSSEDVGVIWLQRVEVDAPVQGREGAFAHVERNVYQALGTIGDDALAVWDRVETPVDGSIAEADELIVVVPSLTGGAKRLAAHRRATGTPTAVVPTSWLAPPGDAAGLASAIQGLVATPRTNGSGPRYLLLVGDADRDLGTKDTIPTFYTRSVYNGATATDRPYGQPKATDAGPGAIVGRLPFSNPRTLDAYVDRVIQAETKPPADDSRRTLRFIASEGRFGPGIDAAIEMLFKKVVAGLPASMDVQVTFARAASEYGWPAAEFNQKVIGDLNAGSLYFTYVGHGWWNGFDDLRVEGRRYPILKSEHVTQVDINGTRPAMFVIACTTALHDDPAIRSVGERLMDRWNGPLAYFGSTRVCHPVWNSILGRQLAIESFAAPGRRLGEIIETAVRLSHAKPDPKATDLESTNRRAIEGIAASMLRNTKVDIDRLKDEGASMYVLLGDPALKLPYPKEDLTVAAERTAQGVSVTVTGPIPDGTEVFAAVEVPRTTTLALERDTAWSPEETMRRRHARSNDKSLASANAIAKGGRATFTFAAGADRTDQPLFAKAHAVFGDDVHEGSVELPPK